MDSSKQAADAIVAGIGVIVGATFLLLLQAYLLTWVLPWFVPTLILPFHKAFLTALLLNLIFK